MQIQQVLHSGCCCCTEFLPEHALLRFLQRRQGQGPDILLIQIRIRWMLPRFIPPSYPGRGQSMEHGLQILGPARGSWSNALQFLDRDGHQEVKQTTVRDTGHGKPKRGITRLATLQLRFHGNPIRPGSSTHGTRCRRSVVGRIRVVAVCRSHPAAAALPILVDDALMNPPPVFQLCLGSCHQVLLLLFLLFLVLCKSGGRVGSSILGIGQGDGHAQTGMGQLQDTFLVL